jgi:hypothetical protein
MIENRGKNDPPQAFEITFTAASDQNCEHKKWHKSTERFSHSRSWKRETDA